MGVRLEDVMDHSRIAGTRIVGSCCTRWVLNTDGHAHFKPVGYTPRDCDGLILVTGRVATHYNTDSLMGRQGLSKLKEVVYINEENAKR